MWCMFAAQNKSWNKIHVDGGQIKLDILIKFTHYVRRRQKKSKSEKWAPNYGY